MHRFLKIGINVTVAAIVFVITTFFGLIAWFLGAVVRAQLPDLALVMDETATEKDKAVRKTASVSTRVLAVNAYQARQTQAGNKAGRQPS